MGFCGWCLIGSFGVVLSFICLLFYTAYDVGEFYIVNEYNTKKCKSISTPKPDQECEDIQALSDGSMLISCGNLHDVLHTLAPHYIPYYNYKSISERIASMPSSKKGEIYRISRENNKYGSPIQMKLKKYIHPDFHPHGMSLIQNENNQQWLYIVNHRRDGEFLSVFKVDMNQNQLIYWTSITSDSFNFINNVAIMAGTQGNFYHSNWMKNDVCALY